MCASEALLQFAYEAGTTIVGLWSKIRWSVAQRGLSGTLQVLARRSFSARSRGVEPVQHPFDVEHGVDTSGLIGGGELTTGHAHDVYITAYAGIAPSRFQGILRRWLATPPLMPAEQYALADLGCGKGRALLLASVMPFREVIGVELNPQLARVAKENLESWLRAGRAKAPVRVVRGDATEFELPPGPCLILLFNPFGAPVMRLLLQRLEARGGVVDVLYQNPEQAAVFAEFSSFERLWDEVIPISAADAAVDPVARTVDRCVMFRLHNR